MSLIADSLKKAVRENSLPGGRQPAVNLLSRGGSNRPFGSGRLVRLFFLILVPALVWAFLVYSGWDKLRGGETAGPPVVADAGPETNPPVPLENQPVPPIPEKKSEPQPEEATPTAENQPSPTPPENRVKAEPETPQVIQPPRPRVAVKRTVSRPSFKTASALNAAAADAERRVPAATRSEVEVRVQKTGGNALTVPLPSLEKGKRSERVLAAPSTPLPKPGFSNSPEGGAFQDSGYYFDRAVFYQQSKDWDKALENYSRASELDPNNPDVYNNMGVIYKEIGKHEQAIEEFLRAVYLNPNYAKAYNNIGVVYYMKENYAGAIRNYQKALEINPRNLEAFNNLAIVYKKQNQRDKAQAVLNQALKLNPNHPGTNYNLAVLYEEQGKIQPALHFYRRFIELGEVSHPNLVFHVKDHVAALR